MIKSNLKALLAKKGMTQTQLVEATGIRQPTISAIALNTQKQYPVGVLDKICGALNCQPGDILEYRKEKRLMTRAEKIAAELLERDTWDPDLCRELCEEAGMAEEWDAADGETFEAVVQKAAKKLGVEVI